MRAPTSQSLGDTMPTTTPQSKHSRPSAQKRKSMASATASTQPHSAKKIKTETASTTEPMVSRPVGTVADSVYDVIATVKVGEMETNFGIHKGLLRRESRFFRDILTSSETTESGIVAQVVVLKEESPQTFRRFREWLYSGKIISELETNKNLAWSDIIAVYTFADRRGIPLLQNKCVDTIIRKRKEGGLFPSQADINTLWKAPGNVFRLRKLLLDMFAEGCNLQHAFANNGAYHPSFLQGLVQTFWDMKDRKAIYDHVDFWKKRRNYYVADNENPILLD